MTVDIQQLDAAQFQKNAAQATGITGLFGYMLYLINVWEGWPLWAKLVSILVGIVIFAIIFYVINRMTLNQVRELASKIRALQEAVSGITVNIPTTPSPTPTEKTPTEKIDAYGVEIRRVNGVDVAYFSMDNQRNIPQQQIPVSQMDQVDNGQGYYPIVIDTPTGQNTIRNAVYSRGIVYKNVAHDVFDLDYHEVNPDAAAVQEYNEMMSADKPLKYLVEHHNTVDVKLEILAKDNDTRKQAYRDNPAIMDIAIQNLCDNMPLREQQAEARRVYNKLVSTVV